MATIEHFKVKVLPGKLLPDAIYIVKRDEEVSAKMYVTDRNSNPTLVKGEDLTVAEIRDNLFINNVDNTTDLNKPISTATQTALDFKADIASPTFTGIVSGVTKDMVGLGNVPNVDATLRDNHSGTQLSNTISDFNGAALLAAPAETTATIQTKRPLKTIEGESLEGTGNISIGNVALIFENNLT